MILPILLTAYVEMDGIRVAQAQATLNVMKPLWGRKIHCCAPTRTYRAPDGTLVTWVDLTPRGETEVKWVRAGGAGRARLSHTRAHSRRRVVGQG